MKLKKEDSIILALCIPFAYCFDKLLEMILFKAGYIYNSYTDSYHMTSVASLDVVMQIFITIVTIILVALIFCSLKFYEHKRWFFLMIFTFTVLIIMCVTYFYLTGDTLKEREKLEVEIAVLNRKMDALMLENEKVPTSDFNTRSINDSIIKNYRSNLNTLERELGANINMIRNYRNDTHVSANLIWIPFIGMIIGIVIIIYFFRLRKETSY